MKPGMSNAILLGGIVSGLLSGLPFINAGNCCCCAWVILGGGLASYLYVSHAASYPTDGEGVLVGVGAGIIAGVVSGVFGYLQLLLIGPEMIMGYIKQFVDALKLPAEFNNNFMQAFERSYQRPSVFTLVSSTLMNVIFYTGFSALGGFLGLRFYRPRRFGSFAPAAPGYGYATGIPAPAPGFPPPVVPLAGPTTGDPVAQKIVIWLLMEFRKNTGIDLSRDQLALTRLTDAAEKARMVLAAREEAMIDLPFLAADAAGPKHLQIMLSRAQLAQITGGTAGGPGTPSGNAPSWGGP